MGGLVDQLTDSITTRHLGPDDLLFATRDGTAGSRNTSRTRIWLPAVNASGVGFDVRVLASGRRLRPGVRDGPIGPQQIRTLQKYLHALPQADQTKLDAFGRMRRRSASATEDRGD